MTNELLQIKIKQRLNKGDSEDYDNILCWQFQEAFNKAQREWVRKQLEGNNLRKEGRESSSQKMADLQQLLTTWKSNFVDRGLYFESCDFPEDYMVFARISAYAESSCCPARRLTIYQAQESDIDILLKDVNKNPNFEWAETFSTYFDNKVRIYTDNKFTIVNPEVIYYRQPIPIQILGCTNTETGLLSTVNVECEFTDTVTELIISDAASILAGDLENQFQHQRNLQDEQNNN